jgi:RNA polymerase sigma-70 factor (ECF subfamily)
MDSETRRWLANLDEASRRRPEALNELHQLVLRAAHAELGRRRGRHSLAGPELEDLAHQAAHDAMLAIVAKLGQFRGESRFTTWAYKFVILEVSSKLGRHFWQRPTVPLDGTEWDRLPDRFGISPDDHAAQVELVRVLRQAVTEELTEHQRRVFVALVVEGVPLDALVCQLGSNRNAIYKTMFDARRKLRAALVANGLIDTSKSSGQSDNDDKVTPS